MGLAKGWPMRPDRQGIAHPGGDRGDAMQDEAGEDGGSPLLGAGRDDARTGHELKLSTTIC